MNLIEYIDRQIAFSNETFGPGHRTKGVLQHIRKELLEIEQDPTDLMEWVDVIILALDGAWRAGYNAVAICDALEYKLCKNVRRDWPDWRTMSEDQTIEHKRNS